MVQSRTHTCSGLRMEHVGQQVKAVETVLAALEAKAGTAPIREKG